MYKQNKKKSKHSFWIRPKKVKKETLSQKHITHRSGCISLLCHYLCFAVVFAFCRGGKRIRQP
jgi:hypothetical protein